MVAHYRRLLAFDHWASLETLAALAPVTDRAPRSVAWLAHVMAAKRIWYARVAGTPAPHAVHPTLPLDTIRAELVVAHDEWTAFLETCAEGALDEVIRFRTTKGEALESTLGDILTHLPIHGQHHRGQIAADIRAAGGTPPAIDFIHAARTGLLGVRS